MLKRNHTLGIYTKRGCQGMLRAAELLSEQRPVPHRAAGPRERETLTTEEGAQTLGRGKKSSLKFK